MGAISDGKRKAMFLAVVLTVPLLLLGLWQAQTSVGADEQGGPVSDDLTKQQAAAAEARAEDYWTPQRMRNATPMSAGYVVDEEDLGGQSASTEPPGSPGFSPGSRGGDGSAESQDITVSDATLPEPQDGTKPTNPLSGPYGPFQRWSSVGKYTNYPLRTVGKLFFTLNGGGFVCSASTIGPNKVITAGHCVNDGTQTFASSITFCPAYNAGGANPAYGCWDLRTGTVTSNQWHNSGDPDYDYAVVQFGNDGLCNCPVGNRVGWLSHGWNWGTAQPDMSFGYPAASPFPGNRMIQTASSDWYTHDFTAGTQISKIMGNDMTGGSSGGPWILGFGHQSQEVADTDASAGTDPAGPFVNGVNSHKRCVSSCQSPPTATNGVFWQEMTSPPFLNGADANDAKSIIDFFP